MLCLFITCAWHGIIKLVLSKPAIASFFSIDYVMCKKTDMRFQQHLLAQNWMRWFVVNWINREPTVSSTCISGYGPAALSDGVSCADCSKRKHFWILNLLIQILCLTIMFMVIMLLQIKGTASPWNIVITYSQLTVNALMYNVHLCNHFECYVGKKVTTLTITILDMTNLDFLHLTIPSLCISTSLKAIDTLFIDYIIAICTQSY